MWEDKILYWAWRGDTPKEGLPPTPTYKLVEYAEIIHTYRHLNGPKKGELVHTNLAIGVFDDDRYTPLNRGDSACEIEWFKNQGAIVVMPEPIYC